MSIGGRYHRGVPKVLCSPPWGKLQVVCVCVRALTCRRGHRAISGSNEDSGNESIVTLTVKHEVGFLRLVLRLKIKKMNGIFVFFIFRKSDSTKASPSYHRHVLSAVCHCSACIPLVSSWKRKPSELGRLWTSRLQFLSFLRSLCSS